MAYKSGDGYFQADKETALEEKYILMHMRFYSNIKKQYC
jgi:hypothetical protein